MFRKQNSSGSSRFSRGGSSAGFTGPRTSSSSSSPRSSSASAPRGFTGPRSSTSTSAPRAFTGARTSSAGPRKFGSSSSFGSRGSSSRTPSRFGSSSGSRFSSGGSRGGFSGSRGGSRGGRKQAQFKDVSKFISKAVTVAEVPAYIPKHTFNDFIIDEKLKKNILGSKYEIPSAIQDQAIPVAISGKDIVGIANTGTGKTASFLIPLINKVIQNKNEKVIILAPTRELALQINQEFMKFSFALGIFSVCVVGGMPIFRQMTELRKTNNFVIGTPGRIKDLIKRNCIKLSEFNSIVLDEADRMLDMGFINDMRFLMESMPKDRQTLFFSATLSGEIKNIINEFLNDPVHVSVRTGDTASGVDQDVVYVKGGQKLDLLHDVLKKDDVSKTIIFGRTKHGVEKLSDMLETRGFKSVSIHGNKNHSQRQRALKAFKDGTVDILVATDVAARGLDIPNVSHVINYELPSTHEDYIHRIGRTGRAGKVGKALTFID